MTRRLALAFIHGHGHGQGRHGGRHATIPGHPNASQGGETTLAIDHSRDLKGIEVILVKGQDDAMKEGMIDVLMTLGVDEVTVD